MSITKNLFTDLASRHKSLYRGTGLYANFEDNLRRQIGEVHNCASDSFELAEVGEIVFPFFEMGNRNSSHLFGLDELIIFSIYYSNRDRYRKVLDLGANIGLHSLILKKIGCDVTSYEPDWIHAKQFRNVMTLNSLNYENLHEKAVSIEQGSAEFVRTLGNTTGSHLIGAKNSYGPVKIFTVETVDILEIAKRDTFDLVKMDVEGSEAKLIRRLPISAFKDTDFILEIGSEQSAYEIFHNLKGRNIQFYSQKNAWLVVDHLDQVPKHHSEGSVFISQSGPPYKMI